MNAKHIRAMVSGVVLARGGHKHRRGHWLDPNRAAAAVRPIAEQLSAESDDPAVCLRLAPRAEAVAANLSMLGQQMANALGRIPPEHRRLFTTRDELRYLAERFGFEVRGVIVDEATTDPQPGSDRIAELADAMQADGINVVFTDSSESADLAEALAVEAGKRIEVVALDLCSVGGPGSGAETYYEMMWTTADRIAEALT